MNIYRKRLDLLVLFAAVLSLTFPASAAWLSLGPFGGSAQAIVANPNRHGILLAATREGILYRSEDAGEHWAALQFPNAQSVSVHVLAVSEQDPAVYYLGVAPETVGQSGLYRSADGGSTWTPIKGLVAKSVFSLSLWKKDPQVIAAGCRDGVYLSRDAGASWRRISPLSNPELQPVTSLAIDPVTSDIIYAGTAHLPWKTTDGGRTWASIHRGMVDDSDVFSIQIDTVNPHHVFASACSGIYATANSGELWGKLLGIPHTSRRTYTIRQSPSDRKVVFAGTSQGLWKSGDGGASWRRVSGAIVKSIAFDGNRLYLATEDAGLLASDDGAETLRPINDGFVNRVLTNLSEGVGSFYVANPYRPSESGIFRMSVNGVWTALGFRASHRAWNILGIVQANQKSLLGFTYDDVIRSSDGGTTWNRITPAAAGRVQALRLIPGTPPSVLLGTAQGLYRSEDLGAHWISAAGEHQSVERFFTATPSNGTVAAISGPKMLLSANGGRQWSQIDLPVPLSDLYDLAIEPGQMLAGTVRGAYRSTDQGKTWQALFGGLTASTVRAISFNASQTMAVAAQQGEVYWSSDNGQNWTPLDMAGLAGVGIRSLILPEFAPRKVFALTRARGVFVSDLPIGPRKK